RLILPEGFNVSADSNDAPPVGFVSSAEIQFFADGIFVLEVLPGEGLIDHRYVCGVGSISISKGSTTHKRNAHGLHVIRGHDAIVGLGRLAVFWRNLSAKQKIAGPPETNEWQEVGCSG